MSPHRRSLLIVIVTVMVANAFIRSVNALSFPIIYHSCQGEGCGCAYSPVVRSDTVLYSEMSLSSKTIGVLKKGEQARVLESTTIVKEPGLAKVTKATPQIEGLKIGDKIQLLFYSGEGIWSGSFNGKKIEIVLDESQGNLAVIKEPSAEGWFKLGNEKLEGYTQGFPFKGCFE